MRKILDREEARQFAVFCAVGVVNTIVGLGTTLFLYYSAGVHYALANVAGYAVGVCVSFVLNKNITFRGRAIRRTTRAQMLWFLLIFAFCFACQFAALLLMVRGWGWNKGVALVLATGVYTILNFIGNRTKTFI